MAGYVGNVPVPQSVREDQSFTATAGQTTFNTLGYTDGNRIKVTLNGVLLEGGGVDYTATNGSDVVLTVAAVVDDIVRFETFNEVQLVSNTSTTPIIKTNLTLKNDTHEDTDGGRESTVIFSGEQSGGEITTLAEIEASHDGTADDQKGDLIFRTNDGSDGTSPTERLRIDSDGSILTATLGTDNVHLGEGAGAAIVSGGNNNVAIGKDAGTAITTGDNNVAVGFTALDNNTTGSNNVAVGANAGDGNTTASHNTFLGTNSGIATTTGGDNTIVGSGAFGTNTTGTSNTAVGYSSLYYNSSGTNNASLGKNSLLDNTTGDQNVAIGMDALGNNTTANDNTAVGYNSGVSNTTGAVNVFVGRNAGQATQTSSLLTYVGAYAGANTTGANNTFIGTSAGETFTSGANNTVLGRYNGNQNGVDLRTSSDNIVLSDGSGFPRVHLDSTGKMHIPMAPTSHMIHADNSNSSYGSVGISSWINRTAAGGNFFFFSGRDTAAGVYRFIVDDDGDVRNVNGSYGAVSDVKLKENIEDSGSQWNDIKALTVRKFSMKADNLDAANKLGVIAQEVEAAGMTGLVKDVQDRDDNGELIETSTKNVKYSILYLKAIKALQEAMTRIETLEAQNTTQATQIADLITRVTALEAG